MVSKKPIYQLTKEELAAEDAVQLLKDYSDELARELILGGDGCKLEDIFNDLITDIQHLQKTGFGHR